jgi:hypothetical protein
MMVKSQQGRSSVDALYNCDMSELIFEVLEAAEGGFIARASGAAIFTEADTLDELRSQIRDAVRCHFDPGTEPRLIRLVIIREEVIAA